MRNKILASSPEFFLKSFTDYMSLCYKKIRKVEKYEG